MTINGVDALAHSQRARRYIGLAPQDLGIYPVVTVRRNLNLFGELAGLTRPELDRQVEAVAAALYLTDLLDRKAGELSGGQKRRLHTAIALLNDPPLILLDESTTGADVETRAALLELVLELARRGSAVLYSTHYLQEVETLEASVVIIESGRVIAEGSVDTLIAANGGGVVELTFDGTPPAAVGRYPVVADGSVLRVSCDNPARSTTDILATLGSDAARVSAVEIIRPSLEAVYLGVTGHRYEPGEDLDVAAS